MRIFWAVVVGSVAHFIISFVVSFPLGFFEGVTDSTVTMPTWLTLSVYQLEVAAAIAIAVYWFSRKETA